MTAFPQAGVIRGHIRAGLPAGRVARLTLGLGAAGLVAQLLETAVWPGALGTRGDLTLYLVLMATTSAIATHGASYGGRSAGHGSRSPSLWPR